MADLADLMVSNQASILIVDDHPENLLTLEAILGDLGHPLVRANSGEEALKRVLRQDFAVLLLDVQMSGMDGFETAALIKQRERSKHTPIIFITAINRSEAHVFRGYSVGAVDYLFKPLEPEILRAKVLAFVELYLKNQQVEQQARQIERMNRELRHQLETVNGLNANLELLNSEMESFSYSASHDLRAPLRSINGFSQALLEDYGDQLDTDGHDYLNRIQAACRKMAQLIDSLLKLSQLTREPMQTVTLDLSAQVHAAVRALGSTEADRVVTVMVEDGIIVRADENLLQLAVDNLVGNAWKFTRHQLEPKIEFGTLHRDGQRVYFVRDNGVGFDMKFADQMFSAFYRLHTESEFEGTGIGLATVQRIIHRHGGTLWAESIPDQGATFYFTLK